MQEGPDADHGRGAGRRQVREALGLRGRHQRDRIVEGRCGKDPTVVLGLEHGERHQGGKQCCRHQISVCHGEGGDVDVRDPTGFPEADQRDRGGQQHAEQEIENQAAVEHRSPGVRGGHQEGGGQAGDDLGLQFPGGVDERGGSHQGGDEPAGPGGGGQQKEMRQPGHRDQREPGCGEGGGGRAKPDAARVHQQANRVESSGDHAQPHDLGRCGQGQGNEERGRCNHEQGGHIQGDVDVSQRAHARIHRHDRHMLREGGQTVLRAGRAGGHGTGSRLPDVARHARCGGLWSMRDRTCGDARRGADGGRLPGSRVSGLGDVGPRPQDLVARQPPGGILYCGIKTPLPGPRQRQPVRGRGLGRFPVLEPVGRQLLAQEQPREEHAHGHHDQDEPIHYGFPPPPTSLRHPKTKGRLRTPAYLIQNIR